MIGNFNVENGAIDVQIGDTYFILDTLTVTGFALLVLLLFFSIALVIRNRKLSNWQKFSWLTFILAFPIATSVVFILYNRFRLSR